MFFGTRSLFGSWGTRVIADAAAARTITPNDFGAIITNRGGTVSTYTLPPPGPGIAGCWVMFYRVAAGDMVVTGTADKMVAVNDATATSNSFAGDAEEIGNCMTLVCDGTSWLSIVDLTAEAVGVTVT